MAAQPLGSAENATPATCFEPTRIVRSSAKMAAQPLESAENATPTTRFEPTRTSQELS